MRLTFRVPYQLLLCDLPSVGFSNQLLHHCGNVLQFLDCYDLHFFIQMESEYFCESIRLTSTAVKQQIAQLRARDARRETEMAFNRSIIQSP